MPVNKQELLKSGFTPKDLHKLQNYSYENSDSLESVLSDLANHFRALVGIIIGILAITIITLFVGSRIHIISWCAAAVFLCVLFSIVMPVSLSFKSWKFRRRQLSSQNAHQ